MRRRGEQPSRPPDAQALYEAAVAHLARYAATEAGLARVLRRRVDRWARLADGDPQDIGRRAAVARAEVRGVVARLVAAGAVSDVAFAQSRARSLARAGRSRRAIGAQLAKVGVPQALASDATPSDDTVELAAALIHARRRRMGPWAARQAGPDDARRHLASFARAGFGHAVARRALAYDREEAESLIAGFRAAL